MTIQTKEPSAIERYIDSEGRLTIEGLKLFQQMLAKLDDHEARIEALEP